MTYTAVWGTACSNVWIVGGPQYKVILQWNGIAWTVRKHSSAEVLYGVWGSDAQDAWAVGAKGTILAWDGIAWLPRSSGTFADLLAVYGTDANNVWAVGRAGTILKWDGSRWSPQTSGTSVALNALWGSDAKNVWAAGEGGTILKWDGTSWSAQASGTLEIVNGLWGVDAKNVWAVGKGGIRKWDGTSWKKQACRGEGCGSEILSVWGVNAGSAWAYTQEILIRWNGTEWFAESWLPPNASVRRVWGSDADHMWGIGSGSEGEGSIYMKDSSGWKRQRDGWGADFKFLHGADANNIYAVGMNLNGIRRSGVMVQWDGKSWTPRWMGVSSIPAFFVASPTSVWFSEWSGGATQFPGVKMWDGTQWSVALPAVLDRAPLAMGGSSDKDVLIPTAKALYRWDGAMFMESPSIGEFNAIWTYDANNIWGLNGEVTAIRGRGPITLGGGAPGGYAISGTRLDDVWVVGDAGAIRHCATAQRCVEHVSGTTKNLRGVFAASPSAAWAVGEAGTIVQWDGKAWTPLFTGIDLDLYAIWGTSSTNVYIAGQHGIILHKGS